MTGAWLSEIRLAVETAYAYVDLGNVSVEEAVNLTCDYQGMPGDRDRRIVRKAVEKRLQLAAGGRVSRRRRSA